MDSKTTGVVFLVIMLAVAAGLAGLYLIQPPGGNRSTTDTSTSATIQGVVTGYVTASPSQPVCSAGQTCDVNMSGYSLIFAPQCAGCGTVMSPLASNGHYSLTLPPGTYTITGLSPACPWLGCTTALPVQVTVVGGMQLVENISIDTGIR